MKRKTINQTRNVMVKRKYVYIIILFLGLETVQQRRPRHTRET